MYEYSRLSTVLPLWLLAALFLATGWGIEWRDPRVYWLGLLLRMVGIIFTAAAVVTTADFVTHQLSERWRELANARVVAIVRVADAIKGLTGGQMEFVERLEPVTIEMIVAEVSPVFVVRVPGGSVPFDAVDEFLKLSAARTQGYLYPVRDFSDWRQAKAITDLIVMQGWALPSQGPLPAKLIKDLPWIAERFGVTLDEESV